MGLSSSSHARWALASSFLYAGISARVAVVVGDMGRCGLSAT